MGDPIRNSPESRSPRDKRKRPHEHSDSDNRRRVRRRSDEHGGHGAPLYRESRSRSRTRSPRRSEHLDRRSSRHDEGGTRDSRDGVGHRNEARRQRYNQGSPRRHGASRSRSPTRHRSSHHGRDDTHSSHRHRHHHRPRRTSTPSGRDSAPKLPCGARPLSRSADFDAFRPLFGRYLDIQKQIDIAAIDEREARGRWKSFVNKWNNGELAEGWYRPETFEDARLDLREASNGKRQDSAGGGRNSSTAQTQDIHAPRHEKYDSEEDEDNDDYGPTLPIQDDIDSATGTTKSLSQTKHGPGIPSLSDLTLRRELEATDRDDARALLRHERKADRALQKERLDELAPRADPGSQARRLEKRREARESNAAFAHARSGGGDAMPEIADSELMGGDGDGGGVEEYKRMKRDAERKRTEREVRREEVLRAKREEREERKREIREREAQTVGMLREIARERFG
ncbi:hypothetical protein GGR51DRAFT_566692 [Nemania sp. FL0031]|nr:hypothetical protein GGR51DRAFT_566692 [Nemania sp. FL0031]